MSKFKAGDKVVALKGFHTIKIGDILTVEASAEYWFQAAECRGYSLYVANYELYKPQFRNMKFKVKSPEHSKEIQEALFEMGYKWLSGHTEVKYVNSDWNENIVTSLDGTFKSDRAEPWISEGVQEYAVETAKSYKIIPVVTKVTVEIPKPETITIDGKTYDKEAVLKRLAELEPIQN